MNFIFYYYEVKTKKRVNILKFKEILLNYFNIEVDLLSSQHITNKYLEFFEC
jgi:hypothetical protein